MSIKKGRKALFTEINITPLTDIFLVLLIIMMVIAPSFQSIDNSITVPEINSGTSIEQGKVTVSVAQDGTIYVDGTRSSISMLRTDLERLKSDNENPEVVVKADEKVKSSVIMEIMDAAQDAQYKKLIVAGEPLNKKEQKELEQLNGDSVNDSTNSDTERYDNWN